MTPVRDTGRHEDAKALLLKRLTAPLRGRALPDQSAEASSSEPAADAGSATLRMLLSGERVPLANELARTHTSLGALNGLARSLATTPLRCAARQLAGSRALSTDHSPGTCVCCCRGA